MNIEISEEGDAIYIKLREGKFAKNEVIDDKIIIDKDSNGNILGVELIGILKSIPKEQLYQINISLPPLKA